GGAARTTLPTLPYRIRTDSWDAVYAIDVPRKATAFRRDLTLQAGRRITVTVVGPDGRPVAGTLSFARRAGEAWHAEARPGEHEIEAFNPKWPRPVVFRHPAKGLIGVLRVPANFDGISMRVPLRPGSILTGRVLDEDGKPAAGQ